jgi:hypothetical protein
MEDDGKKIEISGTSNRYQINKLKKEHKEAKIRKSTEKMGLPSEYFLLEKQDSLINDLHNKVVSSEYYKAIVNQIEIKINGYKQQDVIKKRYNDSVFIKTEQVINKLYECSLQCHYCKEKTFILYDLVREMKQWTLDRINNDEGHNTDNVIISCLDCNLKRRRTNKDAFLFTKQLNIIKG